MPSAANPIKSPTLPDGAAAATDSRTRLLESMVDAIWERSYGGVSVDAICERADVRKGTFYHFFKSKAALAVAALDHLWETQSLPALKDIFAPDRPPLERFERLIEFWYLRTVSCQAERGRVLGCPYFNIGAEMVAVEPEVTAKARELLDHYQTALEQTLVEAAARGDVQISNPAETAGCLFSLIEGCSMQARIHDDPERVRYFAGAFGRVIGARLDPQFATPENTHQPLP